MLTLNQPRRRSPLPIVLGVLLLVAGLYALIVALSPQLPSQISGKDASAVAKKLETSQPDESRIYIPKIGVDMPYQSGDAAALESGAWWRATDSGNPVNGGNFVITAQRFAIGLTPAETADKSPLYNIDKLAIGDQIAVDYKNTRYVYEISKIDRATSSTVDDIEAPTDSSQLTLYSRTSDDSIDGHEVIIANLVGEAL